MALQRLIFALSKQEITPLNLVSQAIETIERLNPQVNAVVTTCFEQAKLKAQQDFSHTPFKGIPILIKCLGQDYQGMPSTAASFLLKNQVATKSNLFVASLEKLGFIILGQTNAPEFGFKNTSDSQLYGDVVLPLNPGFSPGGSSGGAAAALLSQMVPVVAASDGGGSIRIPASYCGLIGLKPTRGSMPVGPDNYRGWQGASINFFLTTTVGDTAMLWEAMKTQQIEAPFNYLEHSKIPRKLKIAYSLASPVGLPISDDAQKALEKTVSLLKKLGHQLVLHDAPVDGIQLMKTYYQVNGVETAAMIYEIESGLNRKVTQNDIELTSWVMYQYGKSLSGSTLVQALNFWDQTSALMHRFHQNYDLYLTPSTAFTAPPIALKYQSKQLIKAMQNIEMIDDKYSILWQMFEQSLARTPYTMLANITGQPAISLPLYQNDQGFCLGSQLMAAKGNEALLLNIAQPLEPEFMMMLPKTQR